MMESRLNKICDCLKEITNLIVKEFITAIQQKADLESEPWKFFYVVLFKITNGLDTSTFLLGYYYSRPHFTDTLIVSLRSLLSDSLIYRYTISRGVDENTTINSSEVIANINALNYDHIDREIKSLSKNKIIYGLKDADIQKEIERIKSLKSNYFDKKGNPKFKPLNATVDNAVRYFASNKHEKDNELIYRTMHSLYNVFSKYEHLGDLTIDLIHRQYSPNKKEQLLNDITNAFELIVITVGSLIKVWPKIDEIHFEEFLRLQNNLKTVIRE